MNTSRYQNNISNGVKNRGFTLTETVIVIGLYVVILLAITNAYLSFTRLYAYQQTFVPVAQSAGGALNAITTAVLPASRVLAQYTFSGTTRSSNATTLVLESPSINSSGGVIAGTSDYIAFYLSGTDLYRVTSIGAGSVRTAGTKRVGSMVNSLTFTYDNADFALVTKVDTDIVVQTLVREQIVQSHLRQQISLRNMP